MLVPFVDPLLKIETLSQPLSLIGRNTEMQFMHLLLNTVTLNNPVGIRALILTGEIGVGKSRLLAELYTEAKTRGFRVLEGYVYNQDETYPYQPFIEVLRPVLHSLTPGRLRRCVGLEDTTVHNDHIELVSLPGSPLVTALARLFPELPGLLQVSLEKEELSPDQEKFRLLEAVATFVERMAIEQPIVLGIDNLQWADSASLELTLYLTVRLRHSPVVLVGVTRPAQSSKERVEDADTDVTTNMVTATTKILGDLMRHRLLMLLPLGPLSEEAIALHLHELLPGEISPELLQSLLTRVEGNPFFLEELVRMLTTSHQVTLYDGKWQRSRVSDTDLPESITQAVGQRLQGLSKACRTILRVAALIGRSFPIDALVATCQETEERILALLQEAADAMVVVKVSRTEALHDDYLDGTHQFPAFPADVPSSYMFCQGIVQEVLSAEVPTRHVRQLHAAIGAALEQSYENTAFAHAAEIAHHYMLSNEKELTLKWCLLAGEEATRKQAHREAIRYFRLMLKLLSEERHQVQRREMPSLKQLHMAIGEVWFKLGELEQASIAFQQALAQPQLTDNIDQNMSLSLLQKARVNRLLADVYRMQGKYEQAQTYLQAASVALDNEARYYEEREAFSKQEVFAPWFTPRTSPGVVEARRREYTSTNERVLLLQAQATLDIMHFHTTEAEQALRQSLQLATEMGDRESQAFALYMISWIIGWGERIYGAIRLQKQALELYIAIGDPYRATLADQSLGIIYHALGDMEQAYFHTQRGLEYAQRYGVRYTLGWLYWNQGVLALAQGDWISCEVHLREAMQEAESHSNTRLLPVVMQAQAELHFRKGDWYEAERLFLASIQQAASTEWSLSTIALYGHFLAVTGRREEARTQLDLARVIPEPPGYAGHFYIPFLAEGYIHLETHEHANAYVEHIRRLHGLMYYGVSVERILGEVETQAGNWQAAEQAFADGLRLCEKANNQPELAMILYEHARMLLLQSGTQPEHMQQTVQRIYHLCNRARAIFAAYNMLRSVSLIDTLQEGTHQLEQQQKQQFAAHTTTVGKTTITTAGYQLVLTLTRRELEVLRLVAEGHTDREVADTLIISPRTVNRHLSNIFVKLNVSGRASAVAYAIRKGLV